MAVINILDKHTAELIAAGEVVERPSSVVKELVENSVDAGAKSITVAIENGGITLIQITDNGSGIEAQYVSTAFIRHATSKIKTDTDLDSIGTLGFRGEALASIASVARVELLTRTAQDEFAMLYKIHGGLELECEVAAGPVGTTISVRDLFYNVPARMKFLKKDVSEGNFVSDIVANLALSRPDIAFKFVRDNKVQFQTSGDGDLKSAAYSVLSRDFAKDLLHVDCADKNMHVRGLVTSPSLCRASRGMQYFFINGRYVKNTTAMAALEAAYKGTLMKGKFPGCVLFLQMPTELVDVNVHPAKTQVRFAKERDVFDVFYRAVKGALSQKGCFGAVSTYAGDEGAQMLASQNIAAKDAANANENLQNTAYTSSAQQSKLHTANYGVAGMGSFEANTNESAVATNAPANKGEEKAVAAASFNSTIGTEQPSENTALQQQSGKKSFVPVSAKPATIYPDDIKPTPLEKPKYGDFGDTLSADTVSQYNAQNTQKQSGEIDYISAETEPQEVSTGRENIDGDIEQLPMFEGEILPSGQEKQKLIFVGEVFNTYIITQHDGEMCLIDKHAAHERILYEKLMKNYKNVASQMLLSPVTVQLSAQEKDAIMQNTQLLFDSGVEVDDFGANCVILRAVPADIIHSDLENLVVELASNLALNPKYTLSERTQWVLHSISCKAAVKGGDKNSYEELVKLAQDIINGVVPMFCPHGRPVLITMSKKEVEKQFGRQG